MNNSFSLGMGDFLDETFNDLFAPKKTSSNSDCLVRTARETRKKTDMMRLRVRSQNGGVNLVTVDKKTPVYSLKQTDSLESLCQAGELTYIVDHGTHRTLNVYNDTRDSILERNIIE